MSPDEKAILVVDDEPTVLGTVRDGLTAHGYRVLEALDGETALQMAEELDLGRVRAAVLSTFGTWRTTRGEAGGIELIEQSIAIYEEANSDAAQRPYNNLADAYYNFGRFARERRADTELEAVTSR